MRRRRAWLVGVLRCRSRRCVTGVHGAGTPAANHPCVRRGPPVRAGRNALQDESGDAPQVHRTPAVLPIGRSNAIARQAGESERCRPPPIGGGRWTTVAAWPTARQTRAGSSSTRSPLATDDLGVALSRARRGLRAARRGRAATGSRRRCSVRCSSPTAARSGRTPSSRRGWGCPAPDFVQPEPGHPSQGVRGFVDGAVSAATRADDRLGQLQDSMRPVDVGDAELRAGLSEVRRLVGRRAGPSAGPHARHRSLSGAAGPPGEGRPRAPGRDHARAHVAAAAGGTGRTTTRGAGHDRDAAGDMGTAVHTDAPRRGSVGAVRPRSPQPRRGRAARRRGQGANGRGGTRACPRSGGRWACGTGASAIDHDAGDHSLGAAGAQGSASTTSRARGRHGDGGPTRSAIVAPPVRTLVISDLHLGSRLGRDVLRHPEPLAALLRALEDVDRLVLLGDTVELLEGRATPGDGDRRAGPARDRRARRPGPRGRPRPRQSRRAAHPPLAARDRRPGRARRARPARATPMLARVVTALGPAPRARALPRRLADRPDLRDPRPLPRPPPAARVGLRRRPRAARPRPARRRDGGRVRAVPQPVARPL